VTNSKTTLVIPMAGRSQRFRVSGYDRSKYYLDVVGKPMFERVIDNIVHGAELEVDTVVCIGLKEDQMFLDRWFNTRSPYFKKQTHYLNAVLNGPAQTVLKVRDYVDAEAPLMVAHADQLLNWLPGWEFMEAIEEDCEGIIPYVMKDVENWGYLDFEMGDSEVILEVSEKKRFPYSHGITSVTCGMYWFRHAGRAFDALRQSILKTNGEYYIGTGYNYLRGTIYGLRCRDILSMNTPEEYLEVCKNFEVEK
tara:strand:- start:165 stop:917 length:753 start_codon:yes stop_codon:yes gene_type:complete